MKQLIDAGRMGDCAVEGSYAHDYSDAKDGRLAECAAVGRHGFLGGGCHALDLLRFLAGNPRK